MTVEEIKRSGKAFLIPTDIAGVLGCNPNYIRAAAREKPESLGFPVTVLGTRTRIPRKPFLAYIGELTGEEGT